MCKNDRVTAFNSEDEKIYRFRYLRMLFHNYKVYELLNDTLNLIIDEKNCLNYESFIEMTLPHYFSQ